MTYEFDSSEYDEPATETDEHNDGMAEFWQTDGIPAQALLRLTYEDSSGQVSERLFETRLFRVFGKGCWLGLFPRVMTFTFPIGKHC